jgi:hypothetical protein
MANAVCHHLDQDFAPPRRWDRDFFNLQRFAKFVYDGRLHHLRHAPRLHVPKLCPNWDDSYNGR